MIGKRPINSGIRPNFNKSSGRTFCNNSPLDNSLVADSASKPMTFLPKRLLTIWSIPSNAPPTIRSEDHTSELQSRGHLVCRLLLEKKKKYTAITQGDT